MGKVGFGRVDAKYRRYKMGEPEWGAVFQTEVIPGWRNCRRLKTQKYLMKHKNAFKTRGSGRGKCRKSATSYFSPIAQGKIPISDNCLNSMR